MHVSRRWKGIELSIKDSCTTKAKESSSCLEDISIDGITGREIISPLSTQTSCRYFGCDYAVPKSDLKGGKWSL